MVLEFFLEVVPVVWLPMVQGVFLVWLVEVAVLELLFFGVVLRIVGMGSWVVDRWLETFLRSLDR